MDKFINIHNVTLSCTGWLDDIGLPQYKDNFYDGRVDGHMLHYLTVVGLGPFVVGLGPLFALYMYHLIQ